MKKWLNDKIFNNNKKTLFFIGAVSFFVLFIYQLVLLGFGKYFNSNSDDVAQYSPILLQYINYFKEGNFSFYNFTNNTGASIFADVYYVPLDVFSLLVFMLSFVMNDIIAFSIVNLSKVFFGVLVFAYFLQKKGFKNWIVCVLCLMYFSFGGCWTLVTYPTYFSLFFYLPLSLLVLDYYNKGKKWIMPLYCFLLVLYNFYNAYTLFVFMVLVYGVVIIRDNYLGVKMLVKDIFVLGLNIVLGVLMGLIIFVPSFLYILNYSSRNDSFIEIVYDLDVYVAMIYKLFVYESGINSFRLGDYVHYQFNYYIGAVGLFLLLLMFTMKDRISRVYKYSLLGVLFMMAIPVFSMVFSGVAIAYTRWFNFINLILIYMIGHVLSNFDFSCLAKKKWLLVGIIIIGMYLVCFLCNLFSMLFRDNSYIEKNVYVFNVLYLVLFGVSLVMFLFFAAVRKKELILCVWVFEIVVVAMINFSVSFINDGENINLYQNINNVVDSIGINENELTRVYIAEDGGFNLSRNIDGLVSEKTFHSFITKYFYDYKALYGDNGGALYTNRLNRINPYGYRVMDYKYVVVNEEKYDYSLDYLKYLYSKDGYGVYENIKYQPFYVYETYYNESDVLGTSSSKDFLGLERNLLNGAVLENDESNLEKLPFNYNESKTKRINLYVQGEKVIDFSRYNSFDYDGSIYFRSENIDLVKKIKVEFIDGSEEMCSRVGDLIKCRYSNEIKEIVADGQTNGLEYLVTVVIDEEEYALMLIDDNGKNKYLNYYLNIKDNRKDVILKNGLEQERYCYDGICRVDDYAFDHVLLSGAEDLYLEEDGDCFFDYYYDDLNDYFVNVVDNLASSKQLTYNKSTIQVKYVRESNSGKDQIVVIPVTYSEEWKLDDDYDNYELVRVNGGFLGLLVKNNVKNIDVNITFKPSGVKIGLAGSCLGFVIYGVVCCICLNRKKGKDENI